MVREIDTVPCPRCNEVYHKEPGERTITCNECGATFGKNWEDAKIAQAEQNSFIDKFLGGYK